MLWEAQDRRRHNHQCYNQSRQAGSENTIVGIQLICFDEDARLATGDDVVVGHVNHHNYSCPSAASWLTELPPPARWTLEWEINK